MCCAFEKTPSSSYYLKLIYLMNKSWQIFLSHKINLRSSEDLSNITQQLFPYMQEYSPYSPCFCSFYDFIFLVHYTYTRKYTCAHKPHTVGYVTTHTKNFKRNVRKVEFFKKGKWSFPKVFCNFLIFNKLKLLFSFILSVGMLYCRLFKLY